MAINPEYFVQVSTQSIFITYKIKSIGRETDYILFNTHTLSLRMLIAHIPITWTIKYRYDFSPLKMNCTYIAKHKLKSLISRLHFFYWVSYFTFILIKIPNQKFPALSNVLFLIKLLLFSAVAGNTKMQYAPEYRLNFSLMCLYWYKFLINVLFAYR
jgi:hypothetical protein